MTTDSELADRAKSIPQNGKLNPPLDPEGVFLMSRIRIVHSMGMVRQPNQNDCWAASLAMVVGRRNGRHLFVNDIKRIASGAGVQPNRDGSISGPNARLLATALRLRFHDVRTPSFDVPLMQRLLQPGRLAVFGDFQYTGVPQRFHVIAVYRLFGDGSTGGTTVSFIDPSVGRYRNMAWGSFYDADGGASFLVDPHLVVGH